MLLKCLAKLKFTLGTKMVERLLFCSLILINCREALGTFFLVVHQAVVFQKSKENPDLHDMPFLKSGVKHSRKQNKRCCELKGKWRTALAKDCSLPVPLRVQSFSLYMIIHTLLLLSESPSLLFFNHPSNIFPFSADSSACQTECSSSAYAVCVL